jgi:hypothetical protein
MGLMLLSPASSARGQVSPARPVRFVIPYAPGGPTDGAVRAISDRLSAVLGQPIVVENRSGGLGTIGAGLVAQSAPDGHTVLADASPNAVNPSVLRDIPFDYRTAFVPVTQLARVPDRAGREDDPAHGRDSGVPGAGAATPGPALLRGTPATPRPRTSRPRCCSGGPASP